MVAGFAGGEVDKLAETHGMNEVDRLRANHQAKEQAKDLYDQHYGGQDGYDPSYGQPPQMDQYKNDN